MRKRISIFILFFVTVFSASGAGLMPRDRFINKNLYKNIYPSTLNKNIKSITSKAQLDKAVQQAQQSQQTPQPQQATIVEDNSDDKNAAIEKQDKEEQRLIEELKKKEEEKEKEQKIQMDIQQTKKVQATTNKVQLEKNVIKKSTPAPVASINQKKQLKLADRARLDIRVSDTDDKNDIIRSATNRKLVPRSATSRGVVRAGVTPANVSAARSAARSATSSGQQRQLGNKNNVVPRNRARSAILGRNTTVNSHSTSQNSVTSQQCFAKYKECMDTYCERQDVAYNRCYCSAKLAQIDSKYQKNIDSLIQQIIKLKYDNTVSDEEIVAYWDETVGIYTHTNPWTNIDNALNIDWASTESRIRGQNAFNTGHSYCVGYLHACSYMAQNLQDAYKSEIERDCTTYETGLNRIQMAAESIVENYK